MMRWLSAFVLTCCFVQVANAEQFISGEKTPRLIELFTSQGCHSCPPADHWLSQLADDEGLWTDFVPLAFHVDYWDWIGWKDRFASKKHSIRQRRYKHDGQIKSVYTPGFVVSGEEWRGWFRRQPLPQTDQRAEQLILSIEEGAFDLSYKGNTSETGVAHIALLGMGLETDIHRGENAGRNLSHDFVVLDWQTLPAGQNNWKGHIKSDWDNQVSQYAVAAWVEKADKAVPLQVVAGYLDFPRQP